MEELGKKHRNLHSGQPVWKVCPLYYYSNATNHTFNNLGRTEQTHESTAMNFRPIFQNFVLLTTCPAVCLPTDHTEIPREGGTLCLTSFMAARIATDMVDANMAARVLCVIWNETESGSFDANSLRIKRHFSATVTIVLKVSLKYWLQKLLSSGFWDRVLWSTFINVSELDAVILWAGAEKEVPALQGERGVTAGASPIHSHFVASLTVTSRVAALPSWTWLQQIHVITRGQIPKDVALHIHPMGTPNLTWNIG